MTTGRYQRSPGSIFAISPQRFVKSSPPSPRQQSGHQARAFSHSLGHKQPPNFSNATAELASTPDANTRNRCALSD
jgi:hypothetical protein